MTVCELFQRTVAQYPEREALRGSGMTVTWREYGERVRELAAGLAGVGVQHGETVALMLVNRPEFHLVDTAVFHLGAVPFSLYNTSSPEQIEYLLRASEARVVVTEQRFLPLVEHVEHVFVVDGTPSLADLAAQAPREFDFDARRHAVRPNDLLTLIYTSGTTGPPKGVQITHANYLAQLRAFQGTYDIEAGRVVSYFPMAHMAERVASYYNAIAYGHTVTCCPDPKQVFTYLPEVRPTFFFAVPRIWEKLKAALEPHVAAGVGAAALRERVGLDHAVHVLAGAAPSTVEVLEFFRDLGVEILEVWGLSETSGLATATPKGAAKLGRVGPPAAGVELRVAEDGEVLVRGGVVTPGYRDDPETTAQAIDADGWLHTGDVGELDDDGYLRIVDRKKELIINASGRNMSPSNIEARIKSSSSLIGHAVVIGDRRPYNVALIVPDPDAPQPDDVESEIAAAIERANARLSRPEQIKRFHVLETGWEPAGDELTPTLKLKRRAIQEKYATQIAALYT
jgi:long-subunit acyl-CoA synthetase (AMP-forming)